MSTVDLEIFRKNLVNKHDISDSEMLFDLVNCGLSLKYGGDNIDEDSAKNFIDNGYEHIEQDGGGEGGSEYCYGVFKYDGKFYKAEYSYYSYNGYEYDDICNTLKEVKPVKKVVTVYE